MMKNILVVDDNKHVLDGLSIGLCVSLTNCNVLTAVNGKKAVEIVNAVPVDFILTDLRMPVMDGYELIEYTRRNFPHIPVMVMTGDYTRGGASRLRSLGVHLYVEKPFDFEALVETISRELAERPPAAESLVSASAIENSFH